MRQLRAAGAVHHRHHVEARSALGTAPAGEVVARRSHHPPLLVERDRLLRPAEGRGRARAHLDEDEELAALRDQVHLAAPAAVVAGDDAIPARAQQLRRRLLPQRPQPLAGGHALRTRSAVPAGGASPMRWMTCVCVEMPLSILAISARLGASSVAKASSTTMGSRLYPPTRSSSVSRSAA